MSRSGAPVRVVVATGNPGKVREIQAIVDGLEGLHLALEPVDPGVVFPEEGDDYVANAMAKARTAARALGRPALADDSGLEVEALGGAPGPRSARYGGPGLDDAGRVAHLLDALADVPRERRGARFVCVAALARQGGEAVTARGAWAGRILAVPRGSGGFGYDPVFWDEALGAAAAELPASEKHRVSHRGRAFRALAPALAGLAGGDASG